MRYVVLLLSLLATPAMACHPPVPPVPPVVPVAAVGSVPLWPFLTAVGLSFGATYLIAEGYDPWSSWAVVETTYPGDKK